MRIFMAESGVLSSWEALEMKSLRMTGSLGSSGK